MTQFAIIFNTPGSGAFSRDFPVNLSPQCRAFTRASHGLEFQMTGVLVVSYFL